MSYEKNYKHVSIYKRVSPLRIISSFDRGYFDWIFDRHRVSKYRYTER